MRWRKNIVVACFLLIGIISMTEALFLARGLFGFRNFSEWEMYIWDYSYSFIIAGILFILLFCVGLIFSSFEDDIQFTKKSKLIVIITLVMVPLILLSTDLFDLGMRLIQPMIILVTYGILMTYISIKYLYSINRE